MSHTHAYTHQGVRPSCPPTFPRHGDGCRCHCGALEEHPPGSMAVIPGGGLREHNGRTGKNCIVSAPRSLASTWRGWAPALQPLVTACSCTWVGGHEAIRRGLATPPFQPDRLSGAAGPWHRGWRQRAPRRHARPLNNSTDPMLCLHLLGPARQPSPIGLCPECTHGEVPQLHSTAPCPTTQCPRGPCGRRWCWNSSR